MERLALEVSKRRVRIHELMRDFDRLRSGFITTDQFQRCLSSCQLMTALSASEFADVQRLYTNDRGQFAYMAFCHDLDAIDTSSAASATASPTSAGGSSADIEKPLEKITEHFIHQLNSTGIDLREAFSGFDTHKNGRVSGTQFERCFPFKVDAKMIGLIAKKYRAPGGTDVCYLAWIRDLEAQRRAASQSSSSMQLSPSALQSSVVGRSQTINSPVRHAESRAPIPQTLETFMGEFRNTLQTNQVRLSDFLRDGDKHRSGLLSVPVFQSAIGRIKLPRLQITQEILDELTQRYLTGAGGEQKVNYVRFLAEIESDDAAVPLASPSRARTQVVSDEDEKRIRLVLEKVRVAVRTRRMNLKPTFQDFDRASKSVYATRSCTRTRFERALAVNGITLSVPETDLLVRKYRMVNPGEADTDAINYVTFCADVDIPDTTLSAPGSLSAPPTLAAGQASSNAASPTAAAANFDDVIDNVVQQIAKRAIRPSEFLRDHDPLRQGIVTDEKFTSALCGSGLILTAAELDCLVQHYADPTRARNAVRYAQFLRDVDEDEPTDPTSPASSTRRIDAVRGRLATKTQRQTEAALLVRIENMLQRLRETVKSRGLLLPPFFNDYDTHHQGLITQAQFKQVLSRHPLPLSEDDCNVLADFFKDPIQTTHVRCREFIAAIDDSENPTKRNLANSTKPAASTSSAAMAAATNGGALQQQGSIGAGGAAQPATLESVMSKITAGLTRGLRLKEFVRDSDPLRKGFCAGNKFSSSLDALGIHLTAAEHEVLLASYASARGTPGSVDYERFLADIDAVEAQLQQQSSRGDLALTLPTAGLTITARKPAESVAEIQAKIEADPFLRKLFQKIKDASRSRRMTTRTAFQDHDKLRKGRVTEAQFLGALSSINIRFTPVEAKAVLSALNTSVGEVTYDAFCRIVDAE